MRSSAALGMCDPTSLRTSLRTGQPAAPLRGQEEDLTRPHRSLPIPRETGGVSVTADGCLSCDGRRALRAIAKEEFLDLAGGGLGKLDEGRGLRRLEARPARVGGFDGL